jgi:hypoxanthine phosphoribosyltransferase
MARVKEFISAADIDARVKALGAEIRQSAGPDTTVHLVGVLKGAFIFLSDLMRAIGGNVSCDFIAVSSYAGTRSTGQVQILKDLGTSIEGRHVVIVEDIVDTGLTLEYLQNVLRTREPRTLETACLLSKPSRRKVDVPVEHIGFTIEDRFVVGYGLDYNEQYRNLPYIGVVEGID